MPDILITNIINSPYKSAKLSDYKGKLVLIDFWAVWCQMCIASFPEMDSLQRVFHGKLQVFLVNSIREGDREKQVKMVIDRVNSWWLDIAEFCKYQYDDETGTCLFEEKRYENSSDIKEIILQRKKEKLQ